MDSVVSIIVPIYNKEKFIDKCLKTIVSQTYKNTEIVLVDDGSSDQSANICQKYANKYKNIKYYYIDNNGVSNARNVGIQKASGDYIVFIDADDYIDNKYIESLMIDNYELVVESYWKDFGDRKEHIEINEGSYSIEEIKMILKNKAIANIFSVPYLKLFRSNIIKNNKLEFNKSLNFGEDFEFVLKYLECLDGKILIKNVAYYYNTIEEGSLSRKPISNIWEQLMIVYEQIYKMYSLRKDRDFFLLRFTKITLLNEYFGNFSRFKKQLQTIANNKYFNETNINSFKNFSIDWIICLLIKKRIILLTYFIFNLKRGKK